MRKLHTILVFAQNRRGVLERITMLIRKKMYNLEQITASDTEKKGIKRITISFSHEEGVKLPQIISQIHSVIEVIEVRLVDKNNCLQQEVALIKIKSPDNISEIIALSDLFESKVLHVSKADIVLQITASPDKIDEFLLILEKFEILEIGRSGSVAMEI